MEKTLFKLHYKIICFLILFNFFSKAQIITTVVGTGSQNYNGDSLQGLSTMLNLPEGGLALDPAGNLYFCDYGNNRVRKLVVATGIVINIAGNGISGFGGDGGQAKQAQLNGPTAVALDKLGNIYIADYSNYRVRKVNAVTGIITTIAGTGTYGYNGDGILATNAQLKEVTGVAIDTSGTVYFSDFGNSRVRKINKTTGLISTVVGTGTAGYNSDNILATSANINNPRGLAFDKFNNLYIADNNNYRIRKVTASTGTITTVAGNGIYGNGGDGGAATSANLKDPWDVDVDSLGNIYIADRYDNKIRKIVSGIITIAAGNGTAAFTGDGGIATSASLDACSGVVANKCGAFFITDRFNSRIRKVSSFNFSATSSNVKCFSACNGTVGVTSSGGLAPYTYTWTGGLGSGNTYTNVCAGNYIVSSTDANGCKEQLNIIITEPSLFTITATTQTNVTCNNNGSGLGFVNGGAGGPYTYTWSGSTSTTAIGSNLSPGIHTVSITDANGCIASKTLNIIFTPTLMLAVNITDAVCGSLGSATAQANGTGPYTYSWSTSSTATVVSSLNPANYSVTATDANGCHLTNTFVIALLTPSFSSVPICFVTVDSLSQHNVITWDKTSFSTADSFFIFRETGTNIYKKIQAQPYGAFSQFTDTVRALYFPNTGDPNVGTYRYKIKTLNSCNNSSNYSPYHNTLYLIHTNGTFSWSQLYEIEGDPNPVVSYILERDDLSTGNWQAIGSVSGTQQFIIDPNYASFQSTASWRVKTQWNINCTPTEKSSAISSSSYSNRISNNPLGIKQNAIENYLNIYPNPTNGTVNFAIKNNSVSNGKYELVIFNSVGQKIFTDNGDTFNDLRIDASTYANGIYFTRFTNNDKVYTGKIVITK